jgi:hypothetical protein
MKGDYDAFDDLRLSVAMSRQARAGGFFNGTATMNDQGAECWDRACGPETQRIYDEHPLFSRLISSGR